MFYIVSQLFWDQGCATKLTQAPFLCLLVPSALSPALLGSLSGAVPGAPGGDGEEVGGTV